jgi:hypothetical protein
MILLVTDSPDDPWVIPIGDVMIVVAQLRDHQSRDYTLEYEEKENQEILI